MLSQASAERTHQSNQHFDRAMVIYLKIEGVRGNVTDPGHENWIEIGSFSFGVGRGIASSSPGNQSNREASVPSFTEIRVDKVMDETSPILFQLATVGTAKRVEIHISETVAERNMVTVRYTLTDVLISNYNVSTGGSRPQESLSLNFARIEMSFIPYNDKGETGSPVAAGYDLVLARKI